MAVGYPLTVAGAAIDLGKLSPHDIPFYPHHWGTLFETS